MLNLLLHNHGQLNTANRLLFLFFNLLLLMLALILSIYLRDSLFQKSIVFIVITFFLILKLTHVLVLVFLVHHLVEGIIFLLLRLLNLI